MNKLKTLFHPIFVFVGVQIAWIVLMGVWINWYLKNRQELKEFAQKFQPDLFSPDLNWVVLLEGCVLMMIILAGVLLIFVFWNKQAKLNRMQSNFVSSVSHELKSPLASIQLYLETMKYQELSPEETKDFVETMLMDTERLSNLIDNILEASSSEPKSMQLQIKSVPIKPFMEEVIESFHRQFQEKNFKTELDFVDTPTLQLDKRAIRMVFNNLISNALRYSPSGSQFNVRIKNRKKFCDIEFVDSGFGLSDKDQKKVFRKFYRVQNRETQNIEGAGLGLFISKEIIKNHKGKISVTSPGRNKGSNFKVSLPLNGVGEEKIINIT